MRWILFQTAIVAAVLISNVHYDWAWGTSPLAVTVVAIFAAWMATAIVVKIHDLWSRLNALLLRRHQRVDDRSRPRV